MERYSTSCEPWGECKLDVSRVLRHPMGHVEGGRSRTPRAPTSSSLFARPRILVGPPLRDPYVSYPISTADTGTGTLPGPTMILPQ